MGRVEKDKNFLNIWIDGKAKPYKYNINTGEMYGLKGGVITSVPQGLYTVVAQHYNQSNVLYYLYNVMRWRQSDIMGLSADRKERLLLCDRLDSIGCPADYNTYNYLGQFAKTVSANPNAFGMFAEWLKAIPNGNMSDWVIANAKRMWCMSNHIEVNEHLTEEMVDWLYDRKERFKAEWLPTIAYWLPRYLWDYYHGSPDLNRIQRVFEYAERLEVKIDHKCDFFRTYINLYREYSLRQQELDNKAVKAMADRHRTALTFENDDYVVVIPETADEIINEGKNQHNCVGSYVNDVVRENCNIVFVRQKSNPDVSYITVEIYSNGYIGQYLRSYNHSASDADHAFRRLYQQHLSTHWGE